MAARGVPVAGRVFGPDAKLRPNFVQFYRCRDVLIEGVTVINSPMWELHPVLCENVTVRGVTIRSHGPNNDGCDPESCRDVLIENCTFNTGGNVYSGKDAVRTLFASGGPFTHHWVGLTAAFKISATPHGNTADIYFECHYADPSVTPYVLRADRNLYGTIKRVNGQWLLWHMNGDPAPL